MHFVIAGVITCPQFSYAIMVAQRLKENLPDFTYLKIPKKSEEWERWLINTCRENNWYHVQSPLIWREIGLKQGKKDFIGDINKFLDLCYDYYGIPAGILSAEHFNRGEMNWFTHRTESEYFENMKLETQKRREYRSRQVCITGASCQMAEIIIMELLQIDLQKRENGLEIRLFDDPSKEKRLIGSANDAKHCPGPSGFGNCRVVTNLKEAFMNVDLVIVLDSFPRRSKESSVKWLKRNRNAMCALGKALEMYAPIHCRVIIGGPSSQPICYNATVLASFAKKLHVRNIVAVTQDLGREMLSFLSKKTNYPLKDFYCPPVWGFVGLNKYIDVSRTLQTYLYKVPGKRMNSTLPQGTEEYVLRTCEGLLSEEDIKELFLKVSNHKTETLPQLGRTSCLAKATAIIDLLKVWGLKQEDGNGEILCLGVYSDGTFNIPQGIYWSQPVILKDGFWVPFADFPIPRPVHFDCYYLFLYSVASLYRTKVKPRIYIPPKKISKPKERKQFNLDKLSEEVGMPVIRTDSECVDYLKYLAKKELGIDLDQVIDTIEEEDEETESEIAPTEEIVREHIYCECWRQDLKQIQKIVFDRSSTTEVDVCLSDIISGSEWSVINVPSQVDSSSSNKDLGGLKDQEVESDKNKPEGSSTSTMVCSCEAPSTGSPCTCLGVKEEPVKEEVTSTENFYKVQNVEIYDEDLKDPIYEDTYPGEKHVSFDKDAKQDDETGFQLQFYGKKDAVRDVEAEIRMQKRIDRYNRGSEESIGDEVSEKKSKPDLIMEEIPGEDQYVVEMGEMQRGGEAEAGESMMSLREMSLEKTETPIELKSFESSVKDQSFMGEDHYFYPDVYREIPVEFSTESFDGGVGMIFKGESLFYEDDYKKEKETVKKIRRKREGIPLCCLCRCLVPEGLPCCPCGTTTVVEVFKKESEEIFIQSEDAMSYRVEYYKTERRRSSGSIELEPEEICEDEKGLGLPPESFLPFSPKPKNKFMEATRPFQLTKEYIDSFNEEEVEIPSKCLELLNKAQTVLEEEFAGENEEDAICVPPELVSLGDKESLPTICEEVEQIKTDFSDLKFFIPCGLEDWRLTVQKKYRDWFFQGPKIKDEAYYDIAIDEVSDDDFEMDKEIEQYFEN